MAEEPLQTKKYCKYTKQMRLKLIKYVDQDKLSTAHAARLLGIKQTSACRIMKSYHKYNRIFEKKTDKRSMEHGCSEGQLQKGSILQNIDAPQKKLQPEKRVAPNTTGIQQSLPLANTSVSCQQNIQDGGAANFLEKSVGLVLHPVFGYNTDYYQIYCPSVLPYGFGYYV